MKAAYQAQANGWADAIRQRRRALVQRLAMGAAAAMVFSPALGWEVAAVWAGVYFAIQLLDMVVFGPINSGRVDTLGPIGDAIGCAMLVANALAFGALSVPLWLTGGAMGGVCATLLLSAGAIYSTLNAPGSRRVLLCTTTAQCFYLMLIPMFMIRAGADPAMATAAAVAVIVFAAFCLSTWSRLNASRTAERLARLEAEQKQADTERLMAGRSAFLAMVGHDLRTPIGAIMTGAFELERGAADSTARSQAALIGEAGVMMKALLDDLLDHAKLEAGRMTVDEQTFNLRALIAQTLRFWQGPTRQKGLRLRVEGAAATPDWVRGDPVRLRQVLNNLISNAVKFTASGSICLSIRAWDDEPLGASLLIEVRDTGPGMTRDQLERLFTPFDQTQDGVSARHGGTGLGLAISRDLAILMGGRLTARSTPGQGAAFTLALTLPRAAMADTPLMLEPDSRAAIRRALSTSRPAEGQAQAQTQTQTQTQTPAQTPALPAAPSNIQPPVELSPEPVLGADAPLAPPAPEVEAETEAEERALRVLVVDDHEINRRAIQLILAPLGAEVTQAEDGLAALKAADMQAYDVIFMDIRMPELDGRETTRRIRAGDGPNRATPVVAVTADSAKEDVDACLGAGMNYFVSKPLTPAALLGALSDVLSGPSAQADPASEAAVAA